MAKKSKKDMAKGLLNIGLGVAGGFASNKGTNWLEQQSFMGNYSKFAPLAATIIGAAGYLLGPEKVKSFFFGMAVVGGVEETEKLTTKVIQGLGAVPSDFGTDDYDDSIQGSVTGEIL